MRVWNSLDEVPTDLPRTVVTLGNFDGVHRGHREVLRRVVELARARDALAVAVTFTPHPRAVHHPEVPHVDIISPCLLYTSPSPRDVEESRMPSSA